MSLVVVDANTGARRLRERVGYAMSAQRAILRGGWDFAGENWLLMQKPPR